MNMKVFALFSFFLFFFNKQENAYIINYLKEFGRRKTVRFHCENNYSEVPMGQMK